MSDRDRGTEHTALTIFVIIIIITFWSIFIWELSARNIQYDRDADHYAAEYAKDAQKEMQEACSRGEVQDVAECVTPYVQAQRDAYRNEHDLKAQQKMANWALGVLIVSAVTLSVSILGVYLVWLNLQEAKIVGLAAVNTTRIQQTMLREERQSYIIHTKVRPTSPFTWEGETGILRLGICITLKNIGNCPAHGIDVYPTLTTEGPMVGYQAFLKEVPDWELQGGDAIPPTVTKEIPWPVSVQNERNTSAWLVDWERRWGGAPFRLTLIVVVCFRDRYTSGGPRKYVIVKEVTRIKDGTKINLVPGESIPLEDIVLRDHEQGIAYE